MDNLYGESMDTLVDLVRGIPTPLKNMLHVSRISTYIYPKNDPNVGKYAIHGASGYEQI